ncbi:expressed protein [Chlorella variabilis]|uniref:Expressed protein n=1 Tax=Chlorella variabilis TaxID=554065 RepID=E1ZKR6_CHLVA|nr:expressed protein [Chlorella variabilis]EFN53536.1 expressed protein [Chlorella variabilis]|eukprot:XP_005845638.1 expressed protein [Chlorella variabilis]
MQTVDKSVEAAAKNKDKLEAGIKSAGAKAGISQTALDAGVKKVDAALSDKEGLKSTINKALGNETTPAAATEAPAVMAQ